VINNMKEKNIVIMVTSSPFATLNNYEALRISIGIVDHCKVSIIWKGNGVYNAIKTIDDRFIHHFIRLCEHINISLYVDKNDFSERSLKGEELVPSVRLLEREEVLELICKSDVVLTF